MTTRYPLLICPVCGAPLRLSGQAYACAGGHAFDKARQGYVNLAPGKGAVYNQKLFDNRRAVFEQGFYAPLAERIGQLARRYVKREAPVLLDAGCGEGYYTTRVLPQADCARIGVDLSREAVRMAASTYRDALFIVGDLKRLPLPGHCVDCLINILTPADYGEFARVLRRGGVMIKAAPGPDYLKELRYAARGVLRKEERAPVADYFAAHMRPLSSERAAYTLPVTPAQALAFARMTPMLTRVDVDALDLSGVRQITIDMELLAGSRR